MKIVLATILIISVGIATAYAGGFMMLHVGSADGSGSPVVTVGSALLVDNSNPALLVDNTNPACLIGGC